MQTTIQMPNVTSTLSPALNALHQLKDEIKKRSGKEGGNLSQKNLALLGVIEATLMQIEPLGTMIKAINQQTEVAVYAFRQLSQTRELPEATAENGDDGSSETKGQ